LQFLWGVLLCDVGSEPKFREVVNSWGKTRRVVQTLCIVIGVYVAGYPLERPEWAAWSAQLKWIGEYLFPPGSDWPRRWTALGWDLAVTGIWLSPTLQSIFSNKMFMWIGRNSFAVYLTHGTVLRVFAARLIYGWSSEGFSVEKNDKGENVHHYLPRAGPLTFMIAIPIFFVVEYTIAHFWTTYVDAWCAKATQWLEATMFDSEDEKSAMQYA
jgi:peptidoglycan/LPS O-acetylase OafA/YrhL